MSNLIDISASLQESQRIVDGFTEDDFDQMRESLKYVENINTKNILLALIEKYSRRAKERK